MANLPNVSEPQHSYLWNGDNLYFWNVIISLSPWKNLPVSSENGGLLEGKNYRFNALNNLELFIISLLSLVIFMFAKVLFVFVSVFNWFEMLYYKHQLT